MAKKKSKDPRIAYVELYKKYVLTHGECPNNLKALMSFGDFTFEAFKQAIDSFEELEVAIMLLYFKKANDAVMGDDSVAEMTPKDRHLTFCYVLIELVSEEEIFLKQFMHDKKKDGSYAKALLSILNQQSFDALTATGKITEQFEKININPKKTALTNHALGIVMFYLKDTSADKQDSDAFVEKTTDLLFRLTDTSTLMSMFDLGKFMVSRQKTVFSWD